MSCRLFSIFNKESRPLSSNNVKSKTVKKTMRSSPLTQKRASKVINEQEQQMVIDCGQKMFGIVQCTQCGMAYSHGDPKDIVMHTKYHKRVSLELKFSGWKNERVQQVYDNGDRIVLCLPDDRYAQKKVDVVRRIVDEELGFVKENFSANQSWQMYLYITRQMVVGCCIAECISEAYPMVTPAKDSADDGGESGKDGDVACVRQHYCDTQQPLQAQCGISRIWVLNSHRRQNIASKLLDCVRCCFVTGYVIDRQMLAFSDPTQAGARLAAAYTKRDKFLVYKHSSLNSSSS